MRLKKRLVRAHLGWSYTGESGMVLGLVSNGLQDVGSRHKIWNRIDQATEADQADNSWNGSYIQHFIPIGLFHLQLLRLCIGTEIGAVVRGKSMSCRKR